MKNILMVGVLVLFSLLISLKLVPKTENKLVEHKEAVVSNVQETVKKSIELPTDLKEGKVVLLTGKCIPLAKMNKKIEYYQLLNTPVKILRLEVNKMDLTSVIGMVKSKGVFEGTPVSCNVSNSYVFSSSDNILYIL